MREEQGRVLLTEAGLEHVERVVWDVFRGLGGEGGRVLLVLDGLDCLLATTGATAMELWDLVGGWREVCLF